MVRDIRSPSATPRPLRLLLFGIYLSIYISLSLSLSLYIYIYIYVYIYMYICTCIYIYIYIYITYCIQIHQEPFGKTAASVLCFSSRTVCLLFWTSVVFILYYVSHSLYTRSYREPGLVPTGFSEIWYCWDPFPYFCSDPQAWVVQMLCERP